MLRAHQERPSAAEEVSAAQNTGQPALGGEPASTQTRKHRDVDRSDVVAPSNRLPRLRRCRCCNTRKKKPGDRTYYRGVRGAEVTTFEFHVRNLRPDPAYSVGKQTFGTTFEIERVTVTPDHGHYYEVIRGGRWVVGHEGIHGKHKHESKAWVRRKVWCGLCKSPTARGPWKNSPKYTFLCWDCLCDLREKYADPPEPEPPEEI